MGMHRIAAHILDRVRKVRFFMKWDKGIDINPEDETHNTTALLEAFLKYVENEYCAKQRRVPVNKPESVPSNNLIPSANTSGSGHFSFDPHDFSSEDEEDLTPNNVAETTPRRSDHAAH